MISAGDQCLRSKPSYGIYGLGPVVPKSAAPLARRSAFSSRIGESSAPQWSQLSARGWQKRSGLFGAL
eukprot:3185479-Amphidinium_carterae.2